MGVILHEHSVMPCFNITGLLLHLVPANFTCYKFLSARHCMFCMIGASALITCTIITSCTLLPCNFTLVDLSAVLQFEHSTGVATVNSVVQL